MSDASNLPESQPIVMTKADLDAFARAIVAQVLAEQQPEPLAEAATVVQTGAIRIDFLAYEATVDGERIALKTREFGDGVEVSSKYEAQDREDRYTLLRGEWWAFVRHGEQTFVTEFRGSQQRFSFEQARAQAVLPR